MKTIFNNPRLCIFWTKFIFRIFSSASFKLRKIHETLIQFYLSFKWFLIRNRPFSFIRFLRFSVQTPEIECIPLKRSTIECEQVRIKTSVPCRKRRLWRYLTTWNGLQRFKTSWPTINRQFSKHASFYCSHAPNISSLKICVHLMNPCTWL